MLPRLVKTNNGLVYYNVSNLFRNSNPYYYGTCVSKEESAPAVNIREDKEAFHLEMMVAGLSKNDLKISIDKDVLEISFDNSEREKAGDSAYLRKEFSLGSFKKRYTLPENINKDSIKANFENGLLILDIPKQLPVKEPAREIKIA